MDPNLEERDLVGYVLRSLGEEEEFHFLRFEFLQRLNLTRIQIKLARLKRCIEKEYRVSSSNGELLEKALRDYATAIKDYQFLRGQKTLGDQEIQNRDRLLELFFKPPAYFDDFSLPHYAFSQDTESIIDPLRRAFMRFLPKQLTWSKEERRRREREYALGKEPKEISNFVDQCNRFIIANVGSLFIIIPTLVGAAISKAGEAKIFRDITFFAWASFTILFSLTLSCVIKAPNTETLVTTFTYATVLLAIVAIFDQIHSGASSTH